MRIFAIAWKMIDVSRIQHRLRLIARLHDTERKCNVDNHMDRMRICRGSNLDIWELIFCIQRR